MRTTKKLKELYDLVDGIDIAMFTTRRTDGHMVSRPMATQVRAPGADFWFVTSTTTPKLAEIENDPHVNLSYYRDRNREWVSVSGTARISLDRAKIRQLYKPDWKIWFPNEGKGRDGGPDDPRLTLIGVRAHSAMYMTVDKPAPLVLFELVKGLLTGKDPDIGDVKKVGSREFTGRSRRSTARKASTARRPVRRRR